MSKHIHFIGIGGIGMSGIANLLIRQGNRISGSDLKESETTQRLKDLGAEIFIGHRDSNIKDVDCIVYSSAIDRHNPELIVAVERSIPLLKRAQMLANLMKGSFSITVAGSHGKTTTTSMISFLLEQADFCPTVVTGGIVRNTCENAWLGSGRYFVAELDESDGSFLYFYPDISIITNIDYEHVDYYRDWHNILDAYQRFIGQTKPNGHIFACGDDQNLVNILNYSRKKTLTFGLSESCDVYPKDIELIDFSSRFKCIYQGKELGWISLGLPGRYNISNSLACVCVGVQLGIAFDKIAESLSNYQGTQRRFQIKHDINEILIVEDYGHHPTEIKATLEAARTGNKKRIVTVFQPHRYTRTKFLLDEFAKSLLSSDYLIITDIYPASEAPIPGVSAEAVCEKIKSLGQNEVRYLKKEKIIEHLLSIIKPQDLVLFLGAGDIGKLSDELADRIKKTT